MKTILIYSGGMDSTVLLYDLIANGDEVSALSVHYGQRHRKELEAAKALCELNGIPHEIADISGVVNLLAGSSLTSPEIDVPEGHYAADNMKATVVPNRNMLLLSLATAFAISQKADTVSYAAHSGDHAIYPDCREAFADALNQAIERADWHKVSLHRPFVKIDKTEIVKIGHKRSVPFEKTWSCYKGETLHCGRCGTCIERREAFYLAGVSDPTLYHKNAPSVTTMAQHQWELPQ